MGFKANPIFDEAQVEITCEGAEIVLENLKPHTDEIYI